MLFEILNTQRMLRRICRADRDSRKSRWAMLTSSLLQLKVMSKTMVINEVAKQIREGHRMSKTL